jgi:hypothetical protein
MHWEKNDDNSYKMAGLARLEKDSGGWTLELAGRRYAVPTPGTFDGAERIIKAVLLLSTNTTARDFVERWLLVDTAATVFASDSDKGILETILWDNTMPDGVTQQDCIAELARIRKWVEAGAKGAIRR